jgi:hypothetical protein
MNKLAKMSESILSNSDSSVNDKIAEYIIYIVPRYLHIEETFHQTKNRKRELVIGRQLAMWLMRRYTGLSLDKIGDYFSRDHATVLHAKKHIDDLRESPAVGIAMGVAKLGCQVLAVEPNIEALPKKLFQHNLELTSLEEALSDADVICVLVKHRLFMENTDAVKSHPRKINVVGL